VSGDAVVIFDFDEKMLDKLIIDNELAPLNKWKRYGGGFQHFDTPKPLLDRAKTDEKRSAKDLHKYQIRPKVTKSSGQEHVHYFLYDADSATLVIIHERRQK